DYTIMITDYWKSKEVKVYHLDKLLESYKFEYNSEFTYQIDYFASILNNKNINEELLNKTLRVVKIYS
ncbi:MAG: hypothetical protein WBO70_02150, partial [Erysipelotrichaceae bacterium]